MNAVEIYNLKKSFKGKIGVDIKPSEGNLAAEITQGEIFGLIGPDGAGKTTLFRILTSLILPDEGSAKIDSLDIIKDFKQIRLKVGYMPGRFSLYQDLTVEENLEFFASVFNTTIEKNYHLIEPIYKHIEPFKNRRAGNLSGGMKQKLALSCALIHSPSVLFLDEPTTGVDPTSRRDFWQMLTHLKTQGITIIVSTPYMDEAIQCDRIALMLNGQFLKTDTPQNITSQFKKKIWGISSKNMYALLIAARKFEQTEKCYTFGTKHHLTFKSESINHEEFKQHIKNCGIEDLSIETEAAGIEDCFMELIDKK